MWKRPCGRLWRRRSSNRGKTRFFLRRKKLCKKDLRANRLGGTMFCVSASWAGTVYSELQGLMKQEGNCQIRTSSICRFPSCFVIASRCSACCADRPLKLELWLAGNDNSTQRCSFLVACKSTERLKWLSQTAIDAEHQSDKRHRPGSSLLDSWPYGFYRVFQARTNSLRPPSNQLAEILKIDTSTFIANTSFLHSFFLLEKSAYPSLSNFRLPIHRFS